ncbi:DUF4167 domain-containing protein [Sphingomonas sp.]|uniref:DUF4167 domain-containing protein n=1 Tax=Sphingomonas sp. TaxID=28214 RepID=UPI0031D73922
MNNRQANNGRRRGRGGQRQQGGNPNQGNGNRIDNRARGNAAQLLEKYKNLARDAQMQGDRVNTEYYLQFADHYFRVLAESRSRFEEQDRQRRNRDDFDGDDDEFEDGAEGVRANEGDAGDEGEPQRFERREGRGDRDGRRDRNQRRDRQANGYDGDAGEADAAPVAANEDEAPRGDEVREEGRRRRGRPRREAAEDTDELPGIAAVLPPALGVEGEVVEAKPRRRRVKKDEEPAAAE